MRALFDKDTNLVGWITKDRKNLFDLNLNWVCFIADGGSVWTVKNKTWIGNLYGFNIRDVNGKTVFWNPVTPIENSNRPLRPLNQLTPLTPLKPLNPLKPLRPLKPLIPLGGWSKLTRNIFNH